MRTNLPVTQNEVKLADSTLIVSKTDLKGRITYINRDFLEISGFTEAELIGEPHNLVRHPDMPVEAFKDLWDTLKAGRPWIGMVKNRCKNGDYYWVEAHAAPIYESGQVVGYMSVRRKPKPEQVRGADEIYAKFRAGEAKGKTVSVGRVVSTGAAGNLLAKMSIQARMWAMLGVVAAMLIVGAGIGLSAMYSDIQALDKTYERRLLPVLYLGQVTALIRENRAQVLLSLQHAPDSKYAKDHDHSIKMHIEAIDKNIGEITRLWGEYEKLVYSDKHKDLANAFSKPAASSSPRVSNRRARRSGPKSSMKRTRCC